jgi:hypothetical protein
MPPQRNPEVMLTLDIEAVNKVLKILGQQPFQEVADLIVDIRNQAQAQLQQSLPPSAGNGEDRPIP